MNLSASSDGGSDNEHGSGTRPRSTKAFIAGPHARQRQRAEVRAISALAAPIATTERPQLGAAASNGPAAPAAHARRLRRSAAAPEAPGGGCGKHQRERTATRCDTTCCASDAPDGSGNVQQRARSSSAIRRAAAAMPPPPRALAPRKWRQHARSCRRGHEGTRAAPRRPRAPRLQQRDAPHIALHGKEQAALQADALGNRLSHNASPRHRALALARSACTSTTLITAGVMPSAWWATDARLRSEQRTRRSFARLPAKRKQRRVDDVRHAAVVASDADSKATAKLQNAAARGV